MRTTSIVSHELIKPHKENVHLKILKTLVEIRKGSFRDIANESGLKERQVWKRLSELERQGKIKASETKICPETQRPVTVWKIKP